MSKIRVQCRFDDPIAGRIAAFAAKLPPGKTGEMKAEGRERAIALLVERGLDAVERGLEAEADTDRSPPPTPAEPTPRNDR